MAQQTINVGTAPNDGTGTPLRTAFQYTNSNFSELYTAVGPSGNNIVVPGSATITGDLTVDTNTLKVDSTNNRVGIGTASPLVPLHVETTGTSTSAFGNVVATFRSQAAGRDSTLQFSDGTNQAAISMLSGALSFGTGGSNTRYQIDNTGVSTWSVVGSTAMTLNSTGLGVGVSPSYKLHVAGANPTAAINSTTASASSISTLLYRNLDGNSNAYSIASIAGETAGNGGYGNLIFSTGFNGSLVERMRIDLSGNVGIGVTPSAWATYKAIQIGSGGGGFLYGYATSEVGIGNSCYYNAGWKYLTNTDKPCWFSSAAGAFYWNTANTGTAGNAITFTQAMTLDASGNLLVGKTASNSGTVGVEIQPNGNVWATKSASTSAATAWDTYSTGAGAYRFYVGMNGTINATNTTISAISDSRLKENVQDIDVGLGAILALKPRKFDWKAGKGKDIKGDRGFIAQEFEQVFPQLVDEWKDPAPEGEAPYKSVRQDLIPVLVKAIQELAAEVNALKNA